MVPGLYRAESKVYEFLHAQRARIRARETTKIPGFEP
jgi:hypothetical protein